MRDGAAFATPPKLYYTGRTRRKLMHRAALVVDLFMVPLSLSCERTSALFNTSR
ncbi:MAG TPA: hypothetical protein VFV38_51770 [Ktedonobacteraceae bacterium]|nr:hypothetical protein [Ktedonobacteraceae bacterium]